MSVWFNACLLCPFSFPSFFSEKNQICTGLLFNSLKPKNCMVSQTEEGRRKVVVQRGFPQINQNPEFPLFHIAHIIVCVLYCL